jgi:hypothetical protein
LLRERAADAKGAEIAKKYAKEVTIQDREIRELLDEKERAELVLAEKQLKEIQATKPKALPMAFGFADFGPAPREAFLLARGDFHAKSEPVQLGFLTALSRGKSPEQYWAAARAQSNRSDSTQQRRAMAEWITDTEHGAGTLVARVIVNRVWQHHFGEGLVRTVNDFGIRADPPTHPELLEWLTSEFVKSGWKQKQLHRLILTSAVYLQDSAFDSESSKVDPENRLLWRRHPVRLEAEVLRDSVLTVSGGLNNAMFGKAVKGPIVPEAIQARNMKDPYPKDVQDAPETWRRSVYMFHKRVVQSPLMQAFDGPDAQASCGRRQNTTVAPQALALLNDRFIRARAMDFARRIEREAGSEPEDQVTAAWGLALARVPSSDEARAGAEFIRSQLQRRAEREPNSGNNRNLALADFCQAMFGLNEFIYVD